MEVCVDNLSSAMSAASGGARRLELCSSLLEGGLTPTTGQMKTVKRHLPEDVDVFALIRPRGGDFLYEEGEVEMMEDDVEALLEAGADGFVVGALTQEGAVDEETCGRLVRACKGKPVTFHRAFDMARDPSEAMKKLISLGFHRLLTSGQSKTALEGKDLIADLQKEFGDRIIIMAGGGIGENNLQELLQSTGIKEFHASARITVESRMKYRNEKCTMGKDSKEYSLMVTSEGKVKKMVHIYKEFRGC